MTIQSLDIAKELAHKGLRQAQPEAIARAIVQASEGGRSERATKSDLGLVRNDLEAVRQEIGTVHKEIEIVRKDLGRDLQTGLAGMETKIEKSKVQIVMLVFAIVGFFFALDRFLT
ncbi:MAG: hypothetical protein AAGK33_14725 [Pseudomonadota bacterium]